MNFSTFIIQLLWLPQDSWLRVTFYNYLHVIANLHTILNLKVATPKRTFYLTGETKEVVDEWLRGNKNNYYETLITYSIIIDIKFIQFKVIYS